MTRSHRSLVLVVAFLVVAIPAGELGTAGPLETDSSLTATVTVVVDGETIGVQYPNGTTDRVRLLGVDTPDVRDENDPTEFEGIPDTEAGKQCLDDAGAARADTTAALEPGERIDLVLDAEADTRGYYGRLLAYVHDDGRNLNHELVRTGHARVSDSSFSWSDRFYAAEAVARAFERGLWRCRDPSGVSGSSITETRAGAVGTHPAISDGVLFENTAAFERADWPVSSENLRFS